MKYRHYRPDTEIVLYEGDPKEAGLAARRAAEEARAAGRIPGIIDFEGDAEAAARMFFVELRRLDKSSCDLIIEVAVDDEGLGESVMDRMRKAAGNHIIHV